MIGGSLSSDAGVGLPAPTTGVGVGGTSLTDSVAVGLTGRAVGVGAAVSGMADSVAVGPTGRAVGVGGAAETEGPVAVGVGLTASTTGVGVGGTSLTDSVAVGLTGRAVGVGAAVSGMADSVAVGPTGRAVGVGGAAETEGPVAVGVGLTRPAVGVSDDWSRQPARHNAAATHSSADNIHPRDILVSTQSLPIRGHLVQRVDCHDVYQRSSQSSTFSRVFVQGASTRPDGGLGAFA